MSLRVLLLWAVALYFAIHAWRRSWLQSTCVAIILMAVAFHEDAPRSIFGIPGFNPLNILILTTAGAWWARRKREGIEYDLPRWFSRPFLLYLAVTLASTVRLLVNVDGYNWGLVDPEAVYASVGSFLVEYVWDPVRYMLLAVLAYEGIRRRSDALLVLFCLLAMYFAIAAQVVRYMPWSALTMDAKELSYVSFKIMKNQLGYSRVTVSMMLSGASWALLCLIPVVRRTTFRVGLIAAAGMVSFGQALTGGRTGYVAFGLIGLLLGLLKWRKLLVVLVVAVLGVATAVPAARDRLFMGLTGNKAERASNEELTAGRSEVWPLVIDKIEESPLIGFGREATITSGLHRWWSKNVFGEPDFAHPHQAYLQMALDTGLIGLVCVMFLFGRIVRRAYILLRDDTDPLMCSAGGVCFCLMLTLLFSGLSGQTFYIMHQSVGIWIAVALMVRVSVARDNRESSDQLCRFPDDPPGTNAAETP